MTGATLFFKDLTRVEQLEERERLRDRLAALGEMAAAIAHEVKNPLAGIEVMAGILKRQLPESQDAQTDPRRHHQGSQDGQRHRARGARVRAADPAAGRAHVARSTSSSDAIALADSHAPRGKVDVALTIPGDLATIQGDPHQLRQLFTNLLINAFEAMNGRGSVRIDATELPEEEAPTGGETLVGAMVQVDVTDDGPGVPPDVMDRIFSPFFTTKPQGSGSRAGDRAQDRRRARRPHRRPCAGAGGTQFRVTLPVSSDHELFR